MPHAQESKLEAKPFVFVPPKTVVKRRGRRTPLPSTVDPAVYWTRFYHARTAVQMTKKEVDRILADPHGATDSEDDTPEDVHEAKV